MSNQELPRQKLGAASIRSVYEFSADLGKFASEPGEPSSYRDSSDPDSPGAELSSIIEGLAHEIIALPRVKDGLEVSLAYVEAESLLGACEIFEVWLDRLTAEPSNREVETQVRIAMINLGTHVRRFRVMARMVI